MIHGKTHQLTEEENRLLLTIVAKLRAGLQTIYSGQKLPKENSQEWLKKLKTKKTKAGIFMLCKVDLNPQMLLSPKEFNKLLTENLMDSPPPATGDMMADSYNSGAGQYLPSNRMSELLTTMEIEGLFSHILGKEEMEKLRGRLPKSDGGPYLSYMLSHDANEVIRLISIPEALEKIIVALDNSNILYKALKYLTLSFFYMLRDVQREELSDAFRSIGKNDPKEVTIVTEELIRQKTKLSKFTDFQLERYAEKLLGGNMREILRDKSNFLARLFLILGSTR